MARGINKVILVGNLGNDPDTRYSASGAAITNISIATTDSWTDKQTGQRQDRTEWHRVVFFNRLAEIAKEYLRKGSQVYIEGRLQTRKWQGQDGQDRYTTEIVANEMQMLGSRGGGTETFGSNEGRYSQQQPQPSQAPAPQPQYDQGQPPAPQGGAQSSGAAPAEGFDDDIPF